MRTVYEYSVKDRKGNEVSLKEYANEVLLIVNTATRKTSSLFILCIIALQYYEFYPKQRNGDNTAAVSLYVISLIFCRRGLRRDRL